MRFLISFLLIFVISPCWGFDIPVNTWIKRDAPSYPSSPNIHNKHMKMTYNSNDHKVYMIGGDYGGGGFQDETFPNTASHEMVYSYDVATDTWTNVLSYANGVGTAGYPEGRCNPGWSYDATRNVIWMTGGQARQCEFGGHSPNVVKGRLWTYDPTAAKDSGEVWHNEGPGVPNNWSVSKACSGTAPSDHCPTERSPLGCGGASPNLPRSSSDGVWWMLYEPVTDSLWVPYAMYLARYTLKGITIKNGISKDNWAYILLPVAFPYADANSFAWDSKRQRFVWYFTWPGPTVANPSGTRRAETWAYYPSTSTWARLSTQYLQDANGKSPISQFGLVYDSDNDLIVLLHGADSHEGSDLIAAHSWVWAFNPNANTWRELTNSITGDYPCGTAPDYSCPAPCSCKPSPRKGENSYYDPYNKVIVQMGGTGFEAAGQRGAGNYFGSEIFLLKLPADRTDNPPPAPPGNLRIN